MEMPVYVGCSINCLNGMTAEEETEGLAQAIGLVLEKWEEHKHK